VEFKAGCELIRVYARDRLEAILLVNFEILMIGCYPIFCLFVLVHITR